MAATVASFQPLYFYSKLLLNNINFYTTPPKKLRVSWYYVITIFKININNIFKKRKTKKGRVPRFPLKDNPIKYLS